ncbi:MAG: FG-GAP-like repeat-containing protein [Ignavibacteria bacterium]
MKSLFTLLIVLFAVVNLQAQNWILSTNPAKNGLNINKNSNIQITFNRQMSSASLNSSNVKLYGNIQGYFPCTFSYNQSEKKLTITHSKSFLPGENVNVILTGNIRDTANATMGKVYSMMFTAQAIRGTGMFIQKNTSLPVGSGPYYCTSADFNNDAKPDIALTNYSSSSISVLKNTGGLNFLTQTISGNTNPAGIVSGDIDCDGDMDIITTLETLNGVAVYLNNGSGTFTSMPYFLTGVHPTAIAIGFVDSDEYPDIITASWDVSSPNIKVYKNNGNGTFTLNNTYNNVGSRPLCIYIGDIDNDGDNDVGVGIDYSNPRVEFFLNDGLGNLTYSSSTLTLDRPYGIAGNDLNGDGSVDIVVSNKYDNSLSILLNNGSGNFTNYIYPTLGSYPYGVTLNDFNKDGKIDIATALQSSQNIDVKINTGSSPLFSSYSYPNQFGISTNLVSSDFDGDEDVDIAVLDNNSNSLCIYKNTDSISININPISSEIPSAFKLNQNYPNPFNPSTTIRFEIPVTGNSFTTLKVYNSAGIEVSATFTGNLKPGVYEIMWNATSLSSGVYYYKLQSGDFSETKKMILLK